MDNDSGRESRSDQPPPRATVRPLHLNEVAPDTGAAEDDWYETERLTGQITGRAGTTATIDPPAPTQDAPVVLDWRHEPVERSPTLLERLGRRVGRRHQREVAVSVPAPDARALTPEEAMPAGASETASGSLPVPGDDEPVGDGIRTSHESAQQIGLRGAADHASKPRKRRPALHDRSDRGLRRSVGLAIVLLSVFAGAVIAIATEINGVSPKGRPIGLLARGSLPGAALTTVANSAIGDVGLLKRQIAKSQHDTAPGERRAQHRTRHRVRRTAHRHGATKSRRVPPAAVPPSAGSSGSTIPSAAYNPQPAASEPAPASTGSSAGGSSASSAGSGSSTHPPAFGQGGVLGAGHGG